jgi:hypothetical protein
MSRIGGGSKTATNHATNIQAKHENMKTRNGILWTIVGFSIIVCISALVMSTRISTVDQKLKSQPARENIASSKPADNSILAVLKASRFLITYSGVISVLLIWELIQRRKASRLDSRQHLKRAEQADGANTP